MIKIKKGLNLPISGFPAQTIKEGRPVKSVALLGSDYPGLKPTLEVAAGDQVKAGQVLFSDKKTPGVLYTSPASGMVCAINRGAKRAFQSIVIDIEDDEGLSFKSYSDDEISGLSRQEVVDNLVTSGQWAAIRTRPFSKVPAPDAVAKAIFITAMDTRPLAPDPMLFINEQKPAFIRGLKLVAKLTEGDTYLCFQDGNDFSWVETDSLSDGSSNSVSNNSSNCPSVKPVSFSGPHPAGLAGTHIHFLKPASEQRTVWYLGYQDVIAIGQLFNTGKLFFDRVVSVAGPSVASPRIVRTRLGACTDEIMQGELKEGDHRVISGSVLDGQTAVGGFAYLGRFHNQISVLEEGRTRELLGLVAPGFKKFSLTRLFMSAYTLFSNKLDLTTSTGGSERAMVPLGTFEEVMPLDILPTQLLRALLVEDITNAQELGCLELDEEDLALCAFACPGKYDYGPFLREVLTRIETEG